MSTNDPFAVSWAHTAFVSVAAVLSAAQILGICCLHARVHKTPIKQRMPHLVLLTCFVYLLYVPSELIARIASAQPLCSTLLLIAFGALIMGASLHTYRGIDLAFASAIAAHQLLAMQPMTPQSTELLRKPGWLVRNRRFKGSPRLLALIVLTALAFSAAEVAVVMSESGYFFSQHCVCTGNPGVLLLVMLFFYCSWCLRWRCSSLACLPRTRCCISTRCSRRSWCCWCRPAPCSAASGPSTDRTAWTYQTRKAEDT
jgi:hypothetical protein